MTKRDAELLEVERDRLREALTWAVGFIRCNLPKTSDEYPSMRNAAELVDGRKGLFNGHFEIAVIRAEVAEAERDRLRGELAVIRQRVHDAWLRDPGESNNHEPSGCELLDRLRGIYTVPVNDGVGPLNGSMTFTRKFPTLPLNVEAAAEIERLRGELRHLVAINVGLRADEILADTGDDQ